MTERTHNNAGGTLGPVEKEHANSLASLLAIRFGVSEASFTTVKVPVKSKDPKSSKLFLAHSSPQGIDLGLKNRSWNEVFKKANDDRFNIEYGGMVIDTRLGMTRAVYQALYQQQRLAGQQFDSPPEERVDGPDGRAWTYQWTNTMLTGEQPTITDHFYGTEDRTGSLAINGCLRTTETPVLLFRPVVEIPIVP